MLLIRKVWLLLFIACTAGLSFAGDVFYCTVSAAGGVGNPSGQWQTMSIPRDRLTVKFNDDYTEVLGADERWVEKPMTCVAAFNGSVKTAKDVVFCVSQASHGVTFTFNRDNKRFARSLPTVLGWVTEKSSGHGVEIGNCEKF